MPRADADVARRLSRRRLLGAAAATAAVLSAGCSDDAGTASTISLPAPASGPRRGRAVIVGGGLAGLVAAWHLQSYDWAVTVLEASDRLGGRVSTVRSFEAGQYAEAGAEFVEAGQTAVADLAGDLSLTLVPAAAAPARAGAVVLPTTSMRYPDFLALDGGAVGADLARWDTRLREMAAAVDPEDPVAAPDAALLDAQPVSLLLDGAALHSGARFLVERGLAARYGVAPPALSTLFLLQQTARTARGGEAETQPLVLSGGADRIVSRLAEDLGAAVATSTPVTAIDQSGAEILVTHAGGQLPADAVVCAVPLTVRGRISFTPPLEAGLSAATALGYGAGATTMLQYRDRPWQPLGLSGDAVSYTPVGSVRASAERQPGRNGILTCLSSAGDALVVGAMDEDARVAAAAGTVDAYIGGSSDLVDAAASRVWQAEEFVRGTSVVFGPGQVVPFWPLLRRPAGRVHFAGEHTDSWTGTMEGAVRSGLRAALEVRDTRR